MSIVADPAFPRSSAEDSRPVEGELSSDSGLPAEIADALDGEGLPHAAGLDRLRPLLERWIRARALCSHRNNGDWTAEVESQYVSFVCNALRLTRRDGSQVFGDESADREGIALLATAIAATGDKPRGKRAAKHLRLPRPVKPAIHSEWAALAAMRPDWSPSAPRLTVLYPGASCRVELAVGKDVLWSGEWSLDVKIDGKPVVPAPGEDWSNICWVSDADGDYLELEIELGEGLRVQRHFYLARKERFLLMADAVLGSRRAALDYRGTLPLGQKVSFRTSCCETCGTNKSALWGAKKPRAAVVPLALPEKQEDALHSRDGLLELRQSAEGCSLFAPLFFDLDRRRFDRPLIHRRLTVAESMKIQPDDAAVGYRVARGDRQWLIYRSLTPPKNRTLLGHNLSTEMLIARFTRKGEVEALLEIE